MFPDSYRRDLSNVAFSMLTLFMLWNDRGSKVGQGCTRNHPMTTDADDGIPRKSNVRSATKPPRPSHLAPCTYLSSLYVLLPPLRHNHVLLLSVAIWHPRIQQVWQTHQQSVELAVHLERGCSKSRNGFGTTWFWNRRSHKCDTYWSFHRPVIAGVDNAPMLSDDLCCTQALGVGGGKEQLSLLEVTLLFPPVKDIRPRCEILRTIPALLLEAMCLHQGCQTSFKSSSAEPATLLMLSTSRFFSSASSAWPAFINFPI